MLGYTYEEEKEYLENRINTVKKEIENIKEKDFFQTARLHYGKMDQFYSYRRLPVSELNTVYHTKRERLLEQITLTFNPRVIRSAFVRMEVNGEKESIEYMALCCTGVRRVDSTYRLCLKDPYREIIGYIADIPTEIMERIKSEENLIGRIVQVKLPISKDRLAAGCFPVLAMKLLPYFLHAEEKESQRWELETRDYDIFEDLIGINGIDRCRQACINKIIQLEKSGGLRARPEEEREAIENGFIFIRCEYVAYTLIFQQGYIELATEEKPKLHPDERTHWNDDIFKIYRVPDPYMEEIIFYP